MPTTLDATPKGTTSNTYVTLAEANAIMDDRLYSTAWTGASTDDKNRSLLWATRLLDTFMEWNGSPRTLEQALRWPRSGVEDEDNEWYDYDTIPERLKAATVELATFLLGSNRFNRPALLGQGFDEAKVGPITVKVSKSEVEELIPQNILTMLSTLGSLKTEGWVGAHTVRLART